MVRAIRTLLTSDDFDSYRSDFSGERLGWTIHSDPSLAFRPVHRIECHLEDGPVVILGDTVFEVDPDTDAVFVTDEQAMDAYYKGKA